MEESKKPAFPISEEATDRIDEGVDIYCGVTIRDYFAAKAMQSIILRLKNSPLMGINNQDTFELVSKEAGKYADAMLKERTK